jgi:TonB-dependent starch-binding outer membrane protein SusC
LYTTVPSFIYPAPPGVNMDNRDFFYQSAAVHVHKAGNIRLQYINLRYSFTKTNQKWLPFENCQLYLNAANLGILWKANEGKVDPDYPTNFPPSRSFTLGIKIEL